MSVLESSAIKDARKTTIVNWASVNQDVNVYKKEKPITHIDVMRALDICVRHCCVRMLLPRLLLKETFNTNNLIHMLILGRMPIRHILDRIKMAVYRYYIQLIM